MEIITTSKQKQLQKFVYVKPTKVLSGINSTVISEKLRREYQAYICIHLT